MIIKERTVKIYTKIKIMKKQTPGDIVNIEFDMTVPMKFKNKIEYNQLSIYVGTNGSGKTFMLKMVWFINTISAAFVNMSKLSTVFSITEFAQFTLNHTFSNCDFEGSIKVNYEHGDIKVEFTKGMVTCITPNLSGIEEMATPIFMSKDARTFDQIKQIMYLQSTLGNEKVLDIVKLYDIMYVEILKTKLENGLKVDEKFKTILKDYELEKYDIQSFKIANNSVYFTNSKNEDVELTRLSSGEQSIINMFLGSSS